MKLIDLLSLLGDPVFTELDIYEFPDDDAVCIWTGLAGDLPPELEERTVECFEPTVRGLNIDLLKGAI